MFNVYNSIYRVSKIMKTFHVVSDLKLLFGVMIGDEEGGEGRFFVGDIFCFKFVADTKTFETF